MSNKLFFRFGVLLFALASTTGFIIRGQQQTKPATPITQQHMDEMNKRGDQAIGFDHLKTTHHFRLAKDGGSIEVEANDENDKQRRDQIGVDPAHMWTMCGGVRCT